MYIDSGRQPSRTQDEGMATISSVLGLPCQPDREGPGKRILVGDRETGDPVVIICAGSNQAEDCRRGAVAVAFGCRWTVDAAPALVAGTGAYRGWVRT